MVDIYLAATHLGKYPPLFTDTEVNNGFSMYQTMSVASQPKIATFFLTMVKKFMLEIQNSAWRRIANTVNRTK